MKYLKTYEVFKNFNFLWSKEPIKNEEEWLSIIDECFYELEDVGFIVSPLYKTNKSGEVLIEKPPYTYDTSGNAIARQPFMLSEVLPTIEVALSYLKDQYGILLDEIEFRETKWTIKKSFILGGRSYKTTSGSLASASGGTRKLHKYGKLKYIKDDYEVFHVKLKLIS